MGEVALVLMLLGYALVFDAVVAEVAVDPPEPERKNQLEWDAEEGMGDADMRLDLALARKEEPEEEGMEATDAWLLGLGVRLRSLSNCSRVRRLVSACNRHD